MVNHVILLASLIFISQGFIIREPTFFLSSENEYTDPSDNIEECPARQNSLGPTGDSNFVRYGVPIKLRHFITGKLLHSHRVNYASGSRQQQVTAYGKNDYRDWWVIKANHDSICYAAIGDSVLNGDKITLEHLDTKKHLHSHINYYSPITNEGEITCFGDNGEGDTNDDWVVELQGKSEGEEWGVRDKVRLIHVNTNYALHSRNIELSPDQQEVTGNSDRDDEDLWVIERNA